MLIPSVDLQRGQAVQFVHGRKWALAITDVVGLLQQFNEHPWLHVIDLDAAMGVGGNERLVYELCAQARKRYGMKVRVGGGIRATPHAASAVEQGADQIIIGSAVFQHGTLNVPFLRQMLRSVGKQRMVIALDTARGNIVTNGWRRIHALQPESVLIPLAPFCSAFLCTDVDREGTTRGANLQWFRKLRRAASLPIIAAGGIRTRHEVVALEKIGVDAAVGLALYKGQFRQP